MVQDLAIARMIGRFHPRNARQQMGIVTGNMFDQRGFGLRGTGDQHFPGIGNSLGNGMKKVFIRVVLVGMFRVMGMQQKLVGRLRIEVENLRFVVIDPDDGVKMRHRRSPFG
jgi:hypothetical protein